MNIDRQLILKLEKLARLELSEDERAKMQDDLNKMLDMVEKLDELDLKGVEPLLHVINAEHVTRKDIVKNQMDTSTAMNNAPKKTNQYFKVPKVIKK